MNGSISSSGISNWGWDQPAAERYAKTIERKIPGYRTLYDLTSTFLRVQLQDIVRPSLLIVGAGGGQELSSLAPRLKDAEFTGVDPSTRMLNMARLRMEREGVAGNIRLIEGKVEDLPIGERYDAALCLLVLHFVKGKEGKLELLRDIAERLKPGAPLFLASLNGVPGTPEFLTQMRAWKEHMRENGIPLEEWERFETSLGTTSDPIASSDVLKAARDAGWTEGTRYFASYLIEAFRLIRSGSDKESEE